ncbi:hypothetical protein KBZ33_18855 [Cyanobium sp. Cruz-8D1]|uniref:hypothetical protein n=1 Tax=Cyanobium sp. Cruz-8D1 TaxID=2823711 RepID=UPI0020CD35A7|nr:hypothetical protein [Cyanobium sp. Cruz-8D1]MCP9861092.1 hypothetical protein [Cyanobium sp. Cruz-8H5]MCP9868326.1 hypothetical protein [Cyanobium sp. Cruz-8D1]
MDQIGSILTKTDQIAQPPPGGGNTSAGKTTMPETNRFAVRMSDSLAQQLNEIQESTGYTKAQIFSRAISLYKIAKLAQMNNEEVIIRSDTKEKALVSI